MVRSSASRASPASASAALRLTESLRRLPTITATLVLRVMVVFLFGIAGSAGETLPAEFGADGRGSARVNEHQLAVLERGDLDLGHAGQRGAVARVHLDPVDDDLTCRRHEVEVAVGGGLVG